MTRLQAVRHVQAHRGPSVLAEALALIGMACGVVAFVLGVAVAAGWRL